MPKPSPALEKIIAKQILRHLELKPSRFRVSVLSYYDEFECGVYVRYTLHDMVCGTIIEDEVFFTS